jgi:chromosomal replication initiation ATPase DnaA
MEKILKTVSEQTGIQAEDILSRKRDGKTSEARSIFMYLASVSGNSNIDIAAFINRTPSDISTQIKMISVQARIYKSLHKEIKNIAQVIAIG